MSKVIEGFKSQYNEDETKINDLEAENKKLKESLETASVLWERLKPSLVDIEDVGLTKNELNKIIGNTL